MAVRVSVQVAPSVATELRRALAQGESPSPAARHLLEYTRLVGGAWEPLHAGTEDPTLLPFFEVEVPDEASIEAVLERLRSDPSVEGAYVKPPPALPG